MRRDYARPSLLTQTLRARQVPNFGIIARGGAALKAKDTPCFVQLQTKFAGELGEVIALHFISSGAIALEGRFVYLH